MKIIKLINKRILLYLRLFWKSILWAGITFFLCTINISTNNISNLIFLKAIHIDKIIHALLYFIFALLLINEITVLRIRPYTKNYIFVIIICLVYGAIIEFFQHKVLAIRSGDLYDILANLSGILFALANYYILADSYKRM
jgi:hypothetical protein